MDARTLRFADLEVRLLGEEPASGERLEFDDVPVASAFLARLMADERDAYVLRLLASELDWRPGDDIVARLAGALVAGRLVLTRPGAQPGPEIGPAGEEEERARRGDDDSFTALESGPPTHWIEIQLVGEDGEGIPGQRYRIVAPDGVEWSGYTDSLGIARVSRIPGGTCQISFPDLDADAWEPL